MTLVNELKDQRDIAIDTETTGLVIWKDLPLFWSLSWGHRRVCMPADMLYKFGDLFQDPDKNWVMANAKYDTHILANVGINLKGRLVDTQVMHALLYEEHPHGLKEMANHILGWRWQDFFDTFKPQMVQDIPEVNLANAAAVAAASMASAAKMRKETVGEMLMRTYRTDLHALVEYASNDAYGTFQIYKTLKKELEAAGTYSLYPDRFSTMWDIFWKTEVPFTKVLWKCERNGVLIDDPYLKNVGSPVRESLGKIEKDIYREVGWAINPNSPTQLRKLFFEELNLKPLSFSKGGKSGVKQPQTNEEFLSYYSVKVSNADANRQKAQRICELMLEQRELSKLLGTYVDGLQNHYDRKGRIHSRLNQDVARTGRLSSSEPNLQNIPNPEADKFKVRGAFVAPDFYDLLCFDYNALEMRLLAAAALEQDMINIFLEGKDIHMGNAELVFGFPYDDIKKAKKKKPEEHTTYDIECLHARSAVKIVGFGLNYGMKEHLLAKNMKCTVEKAVETMNRYMDRYPAVKQFYASAIEEARKTGYAFSVLGRRRFLPDIMSASQFDRWRAERQATNMQIQGSAADVARMAMILIDEQGFDAEYGCHMLLQVHDELLFECPSETSEICMPKIQEIMEHSLPSDLAVPLTTTQARVKRWSEAK